MSERVGDGPVHTPVGLPARSGGPAPSRGQAGPTTSPTSGSTTVGYPDTSGG